MRATGLVLIILLTACGVPETAPVSSAPETTASPARTSPKPVTHRERDYLDALRIASVPLSRTGATEVQIGHGVCAEVAKGTDPEALADDLRRAVAAWTPDNVTAVVRTALALLC